MPTIFSRDIFFDDEKIATIHLELAEISRKETKHSHTTALVYQLSAEYVKNKNEIESQWLINEFRDIQDALLEQSQNRDGLKIFEDFHSRHSNSIYQTSVRFEMLGVQKTNKLDYNKITDTRLFLDTREYLAYETVSFAHDESYTHNESNAAMMKAEAIAKDFIETVANAINNAIKDFIENSKRNTENER